MKKPSRPQKQSKLPGKTTPVKTVIETPPDLEYDDAVKLGKKLGASYHLYQFELGRLALRLKPKSEYREKTLERFAKEIEVPFATLSRCLSVARAYEGVDFEGTTPNFGAAQALQAHPARVAILKAQPDMPVREARTIARKAKGKKPSPKSRNDAGSIRAALEFAQKAHKQYGHVKPEHLDADILRDGLAPHNPAQADAILRAGARAIINLRNVWKKVLASQPAPPVSRLPMWTDAAQADAEATTLADAVPEPAE